MATKQEISKAFPGLLNAQALAIKATIEAIIQELQNAAAAGGGKGPGVPPRMEGLLAHAIATEQSIHRFLGQLRGPTAAGGGRGINPGPQ